MLGLLAHFGSLWSFLVDPLQLEMVQMHMENGEDRIYEIIKRLERQNRDPSLLHVLKKLPQTTIACTASQALSVPADLATLTV